MGFGFGTGSPFDIDPITPALLRGPRPIYRKPLPETEADGFAKTLTNQGLSGLQYALSVLDKPGRAVRGLLAGKPREALAALPLSDTFHITNPDDAVSGKQLLDHHGITDPNNNGWGNWALGVGAEIATDPTTWLSFGTKTALTQGGKALANAGKLNALSRADRIRQGASGLIGVGLPFKAPAKVFGTGEAAARFAGGIDKVADKVALGNPLGRMLSRNFVPKYADAFDETTMRGAATYGAPAKEFYERQNREQIASLHGPLDALVQSGQFPEKDILDAIRQVHEGVPTSHIHPDLVNAAAPIGMAGDAINKAQKEEAQRFGLPLKDLGDEYSKNYSPRSIIDPTAGRGGPRSSVKFPTRSSADIARKELLRNVPGGQTMIDRIVAQHAGTLDTTLPAADQATFLARMSQDINNNLTNAAQQAGAMVHSPFVADSIRDKSEALAKFAATLDPKYRDLGGYFSPDYLGDMTRRGQKHAKTMTSAKALIGTLGDRLKPIGDLGPDAVTLRDATRQLGLKNKTGSLGTENYGAGIEALRSAGYDVSKILKGKARYRRTLKGYGISAEDLAALNRQYPSWKAPLTVSEPLKAVDTATNLFKNLTYSIWPASHVRNAASAVLNNAMSGTGPASHALAYQIMRDTASAADIAKHVPNFPQGLTDQAARDLIRSQAYVNGKVFSENTGATDLAGKAATILRGDRITAPLPGANRTGGTGSLIGDVAKLGKEAVLGGVPVGADKTSPFKFLKQAGVAGQTSDLWSPLNAGRVAGQNVEDFGRLASYLGGLGQGMAPEEAGRALNRLHFDYGDVTKFEQNVMRRVVPFYTFTSRNLPMQLERAIGRPAAISSQLRLSTPNDKDGYTPDYLSSGIAIPTGPEQDGKRQYISSLGLPVEEALERLKFKNGLPDVGGTVLAYAGGMNPLLKAPLERLFDTQFHTGRKLSDLNPSTFGSLGGYLGDDSSSLLTQVIANSPAARFASSFDKLTDPRKGPLAKAANLLTGVKVTDVDTEQTKMQEARRALEDGLARSAHIGHYTNYYPKADQAANLSSEEVLQLRMMANLQAHARKAAEAKKRQAQQQQK